MELATSPNYIEKATGPELSRSVQSQSVGTFGIGYVTAAIVKM